ncbi:hypothetical protein [Pedobacter metabolipauper]|uniref:hypothetical protein n=1 Tax=Pedobacter metabolipauper TaxID=425513 RepID=UPI001AAC68EA|nr:hypothetical protein [Pedobacter metabolipauper]
MKFKLINYVFAGLSLVFAGFLSLWVFNVIRSSIAYNYFSNSWLYILITVLLIAGITAQFFLMLFSRRDSGAAI